MNVWLTQRQHTRQTFKKGFTSTKRNVRRVIVSDVGFQQCSIFCRRTMPAKSVSTGSLRVIERQIGRFIKTFVCITVVGKQSYPQAAAGLQTCFPKSYSDGKAVDDPPANRFDTFYPVRDNEKDRELIAA